MAATNRDLEKMVREDAFRSDLLFRLRTLTIDLPPLAERREDIKNLAMHHMTRVCERYGIGTKGFSPEFFDELMLYEWPGNVRELVSAIERAVTDAYDEPTLYPKHLPIDIRVKIARSSVRKDAPADQAVAPDGAPSDSGAGSAGGTMPLGTLPEYRQEAERRYLQALMFKTKGDMKEACRISGLSRSRLYALLKEHNIPASL